MPRFPLLMVVVLALPFLRAAEPEAAPKTLAEQITYLEGALSEALQTRDFTLLETAVSGFKAAKLADKDLELSLLRAERNAAWSQAQYYMGSDATSMEAWGLMARAMFGNNEALAALRKYSEFVSPPPMPPAVPGVKQDAKELLARQKEAAENATKLRKRDQAYLALALLKEPGVREKALAAITQDTASRDINQMQYYGVMDPLIQAIVLSDPQNGFQTLAELCTNEKYTVSQQAAMLSKLSGLYAPSYAGADEKFTVTQIVKNTVPIDGQKKLIEIYGGIVARYAPAKDTQQWDPTLNLLSNMGNVFPANSLTPEGIKALEALVEKLPGDRNQYPKQSFNSILKRNGREIPKEAPKDPKAKPKPSTEPVKPPKPPDQF